MNAPTNTITVNGRAEPLAAPTLAALLDSKNDQTPARGSAVALNGTVVPRAAWAQTALRAGDRIEIVRVMQGG